MEEKKKDSDKSDSSEEEKPMKKARYVWEIKGKKHLKTTTNKTNSDHIVEKSIPSNSKLQITPCEDSKTQTAKASSEANSSPPCGRSQTKSHDELNTQVEIANYIRPHRAESERSDSGEQPSSSIVPVEPVLRRCCIDTMLERSGDALYEAWEDMLGSDEDTESQNKNRSDTSSTSKERAHDDFLILKWQAHQIARGYADNVINTMLESEMYEVNQPHRREDMYEPEPRQRVDHSGSQIELDAIFEAIRTHGLQSNSEDGDSSCLEAGESFPNATTVTTTSKKSLLDPVQGSIDSYADDEIDGRDNDCPASTVQAEVECQDSNNDQLTDPIDFLNAAVSVAIQKKGLTCG